jgi:hypothetical protein
LLPAYAHNDYYNRRPLFDALANGYQGAEADLVRVGKDLFVGHGRGEIQGSRTLRRLYLEPLRQRKHACGHVLSDSTPFLLNIELKRADAEAFRLLVSQLRVYEELLQAPSPELPPAVQVTLVGWWPRGPTDPSSWPSFLRVQLPLANAATQPEQAFTSRIGVVSLDYGLNLTWSGDGTAPPADEEVLAAARRFAAEYGVPIRIHHVPEDARIYVWLFREGVALIGAQHLDRTRVLLRE